MGATAARAKALFQQGYNCAQSVAVAFAPEMGLSEETAARLASAFGGGMGRMREVCGAVSGMLLVAGMLYGYSDPTSREEKRETYALVQRLAARFRQENGSIVCRELLGLASKELSPEPTPRTAEFYRKRPCGDLVYQAASLLEELGEKPE